MKKYFICLAALTLSLQVLASDSPKEVLKAKSIFGERLTEFVITREGQAYLIKMNSNSGAKREHVLSQSDFAFLKAEFEKLPIAPTIPNECSRFNISITLRETSASSKTKASCFGMKTLTEPAYVRFAQILVNAI